jgi:hypothetical protein
MGLVTGAWANLSPQAVPMSGDIDEITVTEQHLVLIPDAGGYKLKSMIPPDNTTNWRVYIVNADDTKTFSVELPFLAAAGTVGYQFFYDDGVNPYTKVTLLPSQTQSVVFVPGEGWLIEVPGSLS